MAAKRAGIWSYEGVAMDGREDLPAGFRKNRAFELWDRPSGKDYPAPAVQIANRGE